MVKFLLNIGAPNAIDPVLLDYADNLVLDAETDPALVLAAAQKFADALHKQSGGRLKSGQAAEKSRAKAALPKAAPAPLSLILPFSLFQAEGGKAKQAAILAQAAKNKAVSMFCFAVPRSRALKRGKDAAKAVWADTAAFTARHESFLLLPYAQEDSESGQKAFGDSLIFWLEKARKGGFKGILLSCLVPPMKSRMKFITFSGRFLQEVQRTGLRAGIIGGLQIPDIPRLLPYAPDYLGFSYQAGAECGAAGDKSGKQPDSSIHNKEMPALIRSFIPRAKAAGSDGVAADEQDLGMDKILVTDFIVPVHIGAYTHEKGAAQPVCFNIAAEIARVTRNPHNMNHIFSYDIILDAVERLASQGHIELVETLAEQIATFLLEFPRVERVTVRVEKLNLAPRAVGVEITRSRRGNRAL